MGVKKIKACDQEVRCIGYFTGLILHYIGGLPPRPEGDRGHLLRGCYCFASDKIQGPLTELMLVVFRLAWIQIFLKNTQKKT